MYLQGFGGIFVNNCNDINKNPKVFQKNADNISVSKKKAKQKVHKKGLVVLTNRINYIYPAVD